MIRLVARLAISTALLAVASVTAYAATQAQDPEAIRSLEAERGGTRVSLNPATGTARFVRLPPSAVAKSAAAPSVQAMQDTAASFINQHARAFGLSRGMADLQLQKTETDSVGATHLNYAQQYAGLPVFGAVLKVHLDAAGQVSVVTGTLIPGHRRLIGAGAERRTGGNNGRETCAGRQTWKATCGARHSTVDFP